MESPASHAVSVRLSSGALERTLRTHIFREPLGRFYLKGHEDAASYLFAENPTVNLRGDRIVVGVGICGRIGASIRGRRLGLDLDFPTAISLVPEAEGDSIGFRDAEIESLGRSEEITRLLTPLLRRKIPQNLKLSASHLLRQALTSSQEATGYHLRLATLSLQSLRVENEALVLKLDGALEVS